MTEPAKEYRIDDLAHTAGTTVRSLRMFADRGLLPPPRLQGRTGFYDDHHLARVRLVLRLQDRGFSIAAIKELLSAWENGRDLRDVLGFEQALTGPWNDEPPRHYSLPDLIRRFGRQLTRSTLRRCVAAGILQRDRLGFRARSPQLVEVAADLAADGLPLSVVLDLTDQLQRDMAAVAERLVKVVGDHLAGQLLPDGLPERERVAELSRRITAHSAQGRRAVDAWFAVGMDAAVADYVGSIGSWARDGAPRPPGTAADADPLSGLDLSDLPDG